MDGILGHNLLLSQAFFGGNPFMDGILGFHGAFFTNSSFFDNRILAIRKPLTRIFSFSMESRLSQSPFHELFFLTMEPWLSRSPFHEFFFFTMELWLSRSPFHEFFFFTITLAITKPFSRIFLSRWKSCYQGAFHTNSFFFHDGTLAIKEPFTRTIFSFTMEFWLSRSLAHKLFFLSRWNSGYQGSFHTNSFFFHDGIHKIRDLGEDSFHIYHRVFT
jgi:hypothetical protein